jgi:hypothetical protein
MWQERKVLAPWLLALISDFLMGRTVHLFQDNPRDVDSFIEGGKLVST